MLIVFTLYLLATLVLYFQAYPLPEFALKIYSLAVACFVLTGAWAAGRPVVRWLRLKFSDENSEFDSVLTEFIFPVGLGIGVLSTSILLLDLLPGSLAFKLPVLAFFLSISVLVQKKEFAEALLTLKSKRTVPIFSVEGICYLIAAMGMIFSFLTCFSPITYYDSLVYHLALPSIYSLNENISPVPFNLYSFFPQNMEMIYLYILKLTKNIPADYTVNLVNWTISALTGLMIHQWMNKKAKPRRAALALALWWSAPSVILLSVGGYVDIPLAFFTTAALICFCESMEMGWDPSGLMVAALFCSLACSTKYTGGLTAAILSIYLGLAILVSKPAEFKKVLLFTGFLLFPFGLWLLRNFIHIGNPFFPFFYNVFGGSIGWTQQSAAGYFQMLTEYGSSSHLFFQLILAPWKIATTALPFGGGMDVLGDFGWGLFIYAAILTLFVSSKNRLLKFLMLYVVIHFSCWVLLKPVLRFLVGVLPLFAMLAATSLDYFSSQAKKHWRFLPLILTVPWLLSNFFMTGFLSAELKNLPVALGIENQSEFLDKRLAYHSAYEFLNKNISAHETVLILGEQRTYRLNVSFLASNIFAPSQLALWSNQSRSVDDIKNHLAGAGISKIMISEWEMKRLGGLSSFGFNQKGQQIWSDFLKEKWPVIFDKNGVKILDVTHVTT